MRRLTKLAVLFLLLATAAQAEPVHGIAMHGNPALPADYKNFPYVNPAVKKGGRVSYGVVGTFDSLNPFNLKSIRTTARGMWDPSFGNLVYESLMIRSADEPFTLYGLLAESVEWDADRTFIQFNLNPKAKWADGQPVTPEDVIFSFEVLQDKGRTPFNNRLKPVEKMEKVGARSVRFTFNKLADREFPLILAAGTPILPKHLIDKDTFDQSSLKIPVGSGPYRVKSVTPGQRIVYERDPNYWGTDIPSKVGFDNYDEISVDYFLQENSLFEAFKKGLIDIYLEGNPTHWSRGYDFPAVTNGDVIKDVFKPELPSGMLGFVFNLRRAPFNNQHVRQGLALAFDFDWANRNLFDGAYTHTLSYWQGSELSSLNNPADEAELALLGEAAKKISPEILAGKPSVPETDGSGSDRKALRQVVDQLKQGGYTIKGGKMVDASGRPLAFEIMTQNADQEKVAISYQRTLRMIGIDVAIRTVDDAQYQSRSSSFDYDVIMKSYPSSLSPGIEQVGRWGSDSKDRQGSFNFAGLADTDVDRVIQAMLNARTREEFRTAVRAYDRLLLAGAYLVPLYNIPEQWVARWKYIQHTEKVPLYGYQLSTWWDARAQTP